MSTLTITAPAKIRVANTNASLATTFAPYKENFTVALAAGKAVEFEVKTSGQVLYYLGQKTKDISVSIVTNYTSDGNTTVLNVPANIAIINTGNKSIGFVPYRENFPVYIEAGNEVDLTASNVGQVLYYLAQATDNLTVTQSAVSND